MSTERSLDPPEKRWPRGTQLLTIYVERGDEEIEVEVEFDEGSVYQSHVAGTETPIELTPDEKERAEVDYSEDLIAREEAAREDAADAREDR
jgi:hypothetical protein